MGLGSWPKGGTMKGDDIAQELLSYGVGVMRRMGKFSKDAGAKHVAQQLARSGTPSGAHDEEARRSTSPFPAPGSPVSLQGYLCKVVSARNRERVREGGGVFTLQDVVGVKGQCLYSSRCVERRRTSVMCWISVYRNGCGSWGDGV
jgi:hypothetical protein